MPKKLLFYYSAAASLFITASMVFTSQTAAPLIFAVLFLPVTAYFVVEFFNGIRSKLNPKESSNVPIYSGTNITGNLVLLAIFLTLLGLGVRNVYYNSIKLASIEANTLPSSVPIVISKTQTPEPGKAKTLTISITDGSQSVNIRAKPTIYSDKVAEAKNGTILPYTEKKGEWYEVTLEDSSVGYISFKYVEEGLR